MTDSGLGADAKEFLVMPPGPVHKNRKYMLGKYNAAAPDWKDPQSRWRLYHEVSETQKKNRDAKDSSRQPLLLEKKPGELALRGTIESGLTDRSSAAYFVLAKSGADFVAFPVESWYTFKPLYNNRRGADSLEAAEKMLFGDENKEGSKLMARLVPASVARQEAAAKEMQGQESALGMTGRSQRSMPDDIERLFGDNADPDAAFAGRSRGRGGGRRPGRPKAAADGDFELHEDEVPEDIYENEGDALRPDKPEQAEDWEHEAKVDDDDEFNWEGGEEDDDKLQDDPGERKKLGLEVDEEEEETDELGKTLKKHLKEEDEEEEEPEEKAAEEKPADEEEEEEDLDTMAVVVGATIGIPSGTPDRPRSPAPRTLGAGPSTAGRRPSSTPPPAAVGVKRRGEGPDSGASKRLKSVTPPPEAPIDLQTLEEKVMVILRNAGGRMKVSELTAYFKTGLPGEDMRETFKNIVKKVGMLQKLEGVNYLVMKEQSP